MECPKCKADDDGIWKQIIDENGIRYYRCSSCHYENHHIEIQRKNLLKKEQDK